MPVTQQQDVVELCQQFAQQQVRYWLVGGWGVDALLGEQTRPHKDLDLYVDVATLAAAMVILRDQGYSLSYLWDDQNVWLPGTAENGEADGATAFVLGRSSGSEVDIHVVALEDDAPTPLWDTPMPFIDGALDGQGTIGGKGVPCLSLEMQLLRHQGYDLPAAHAADLRRLQELKRERR